MYTVDFMVNTFLAFILFNLSAFMIDIEQFVYMLKLDNCEFDFKQFEPNLIRNKVT